MRRRGWIGFCCLVVLGAAAAFAADEAQKTDTGPSLEYRPPKPILPEPKGPTPAPPVAIFRDSFGGFGIGRGSLDKPLDVAFGTDERVYVLDAGNSRVQLFDDSKHFVLEWGTAGTDATRCEFNRPTAIHVIRSRWRDAPDIVHVVDSGSNRIQRFAIKADTKSLRNLPCTSPDSDVKILSPWGGEDKTGGIREGKFRRPLDLAFGVVGAEDSMWVLDAGNERVQRFAYLLSANGYPPNEKNQEEIFYRDQISEISGSRGDLKGLVSLAWSHEESFDYIYLLGTGCAIQKFKLSPLGSSSTMAVLDQTWPAVAPESGLCVPARVRYDREKEYVYVLDSGNSMLSIFHRGGNFISAIRGASRSFDKPGGLSFRPESGEFAVADTGNDLVQKFTLR